MPPDPPDEAVRLTQVISRALTDMLQAAGFPGGVLLALTPDGRLLFISAMPDQAPTSAEELLRTALHYLDAGGAPGAPPMNG